MTRDEFARLDVGSIVRHKSGGHGYVVTAHYGNRVTAVRTVDMMNHTEWDLIQLRNLAFHENLDGSEK